MFQKRVSNSRRLENFKDWHKVGSTYSNFAIIPKSLGYNYANIMGTTPKRFSGFGPV